MRYAWRIVGQHRQTENKVFYYLSLITASFTAPQQIHTNAKLFLWLLPLVAAFAIVYKALVLHKIDPLNFLKETVILFFSILIFLVLIASALYAITAIVT